MDDNSKKIDLGNQFMIDEGIDFIELFQVLWSEKLKIIFITFFAVIFSIYYSLSLPDIYKSETILAPASSSGSSLSSMAGQYAGVASLAGISIPSSGETDQVAMGIKIMQSFNFFERLVTDNDLYFNLIAPNGWNAESNKLVIDSDIYNEKTKSWVST